MDKIKPDNFDIWVHAVSLGEMIAATPLIEELLKKNYKILITTMTPTGSERAQLRFGTRVSHRYLPYDLPIVVKRFFTAFKPRVGLIIETELWPNLITYAKRSNVRLLLVNARLSEQSFKGYKKFTTLFRPILNQFSGILAQGEDDAKRFHALGTDSSLLSIFGNIKFDLDLGAKNYSFSNLKDLWGKDRTTLIIASTHDNEEALILKELSYLKEKIPDLILLIAPRHPERFQKVYNMAINLGFKTGLRSQEQSINADMEIIVLDSLGELLGFYQLSDYAFVGGSLVAIGGHNVLEPIAMGVPVFTGKHVHNFKFICEDLGREEAIEFIDNAKDLVNKIIHLHENKDKKQQRIEKATTVMQKNKGALDRYLSKVEALLSSNS